MSRPSSALQRSDLTDEQWALFVERVAAGESRTQAEEALGLNSYSTQTHMILDERAREQFEEAELAAVRREVDVDAVDEILAAVAAGEKIPQACQEHFVSPVKFYRWVLKDPLLKDRYDAARKVRAEHMFDQMLSIADDNEEDVYVDERGRERVNHDVVKRSELKVRTRQWALARLDRARYGERTQQDVNVNATVNHAETLDNARRRKEHAAAQRKQRESENRPPVH